MDKSEIKKNVIFFMMIAAFLTDGLPKPINYAASLVILISTLCYLIIDIFRNGNEW